MHKRSTFTQCFTSTKLCYFHFQNTAQVKGSGIAQAFGQAAAEQHCHVLNTPRPMSPFIIVLNPRLEIEGKKTTGYIEFSE